MFPPPMIWRRVTTMGTYPQSCRDRSEPMALPSRDGHAHGHDVLSCGEPASPVKPDRTDRRVQSQDRLQTTEILGLFSVPEATGEADQQSRTEAPFH